MNIVTAPHGQKQHSIIRQLTFGLASIVSLVLALAVFVVAAVGFVVDDVRNLIIVPVIVASIATLILTMLLSWRILRAIQQPLNILEQEIVAIDTGATHRRVPPLAAVEFEQLGRGINRMLDNLDQSMSEAEFQQRRLATIVESANEGIVVIDAAGLITTINPAAARMFDVEADSAPGRRATDLGLFSEQDFALGLGRTRGSRGEGQPIVRRYGDIVLSAVVSPLGTSGDLPGVRPAAGGWVCIIRDVTELTRIDEMKNEFISVVSHELRTPLTAIKGFTDLILEGEAGDVTEAQREFLEIVQSNSDRLVALINDMLDISRIESGRISLALDEVYVPDIIRQTLSALRPLVDEKQLNVRTEIDVEIPPIVGDAGRLLQILTNLVSNACKYTDAGGWITVAAEPLDGLVAVSVSDTGIGIPADALPRVFSKFYRVDQAAAREVGGTGLGLAITKSLVEMHGGRITIASRPTVGTTVRFTIPTINHATVSGDDIATRGMSTPVALIVSSNQPHRDRWAAALRAIPMTVAFPRSLSIAALIAETDMHHPVAIVLDADAGIDLDDLLAELDDLVEHAGLTVFTIGAPASSTGGARVVALPTGIADAGLAAAVESALPAVTGTVPRRGRVLVAEDDLDSANWLRRLLSSNGFEVLIVHDGLSAVVRAIETLPDIVILDVNMPKMGASEVLPQLRGNPGTRDIPIIVMSGTVPDSRPYFIEAGATDFFTKPIDGDILIDRLIDLRKR